ncbi:MAG: type I 3-dehydroquinate dehydratase [Chthoniobacterales bacterium]|jgi:3-dehydroquinate dehydratase-1
MKSRKRRALVPRTEIVGSVHTLAGLRRAARLRPGQGVDVIEVRLDWLADEARKLPGLLRSIRLPLLLTARHPREGGNGCLSLAARRQLLETFLPLARMVDIELRSAGSFRDLLGAARKMRVKVVLSSHHFYRAPTQARLVGVERQAWLLGADICKIAVHIKNAAELARLLVLQSGARRPLATMGMGPLGKVSRLVLPLAGSRLVYGYIDRPQVPGQWPAIGLRERLQEVTL